MSLGAWTFATEGLKTLLSLISDIQGPSGNEKALTKTQMEFANLLLSQLKSRMANENAYMPPALNAAFNYAEQVVNRPRGRIYAEGIFEPVLHDRPKIDFKLPEWTSWEDPNPDWKIGEEEVVDPDPDPVPGPVPPGGTNPGQESPGGGAGPANMPPGLGWVSPGLIKTDTDTTTDLTGPANMGPLYPGSSYIDEGENRITGPANMGPMYPGTQGQWDDPNAGRPPGGLGNRNVFPGVYTDPNAGRPPGGLGNRNVFPGVYTDPNAGRPPGGLGNRNVFPGVYTDPNAGRPEGGIGNRNVFPGVYTDPNAGRPEGSIGNRNVFPGVYTDPNAGRPEGGIGLANHLPTLRTGEEGQGYGPGYTPHMVAPTLRTGEEGQGYGPGYTPHMVAPTLRTGEEGQGYSAAGYHPEFVSQVPHSIIQGVELLNSLPKNQRDDLIASTGGLPSGLFVMPNGMIGISGGGAGINNMMSAWIMHAVDKMSNPPDALRHSGSGGRSATAFSTDPATRYGVRPGDEFDPVTGQRKRKRG